MSEITDLFISQSEQKAFDIKHRNTIRFNIGRYDMAVAKGKKKYSNLQLAKKRAAVVKHKAVNELEEYLIEFEAAFNSRGGKVVWAEDAEQARNEVYRILKKYDIRLVVKSKSMITEELHLNDFLGKNGIDSIETDLGEYIVQISDDRPYHIVTPVMHRSKEDIAVIFNQKFGLPVDSTPEQITAFVRNELREKFTKAGAGITGANFLIADIGAIALTENEGNGVMSMSWPKIHIAIAGIEKIIPSLKDLDLFWPLLATHGTGQNMTVYNSVVSGPKSDKESEGPVEMYVILVDNGRSNLLSQIPQRKALTCIRCGACLNACPVYRTIGGHTYQTVYSGPIGSVISPHLLGLEKYKHLSFASSLCGKCTEVCPVEIDLHAQLLYNRRDSVKAGYINRMDKISMFIWKTAMSNRWMIDLASPALKNAGLNLLFKKLWGPRRNLPKVQPKTFHTLWAERNKK